MKTQLSLRNFSPLYAIVGMTLVGGMACERQYDAGGVQGGDGSVADADTADAMGGWVIADSATDSHVIDPGSAPDADTGPGPDNSNPDTSVPDTMLPVAVGSAVEDGPCRAYLPGLPFEGLPPISDGETIWTAHGLALMAYKNSWRIIGPGGREFLDAPKQPIRWEDMVAEPGIFAVSMGDEVFVKTVERELRIQSPPRPNVYPFHADLHLDGKTVLIASSTGVFRLDGDKWQRLGAEFSATNVIGKNGVYYATTAAGMVRYENGIWTGITGVTSPIGIADRGDGVVYYISWKKLGRIDKSVVTEPVCPPGVTTDISYEQIMGGGGRLIVQGVCNTRVKLWEMKGNAWEAIDVDEPASSGQRLFELDAAGRLSRAKGQAFYENGKWVPLQRTAGAPSTELRYSSKLGFYGLSSSQPGVVHLKNNEWTVIPGSESVTGTDVWTAENGGIFVSGTKPMHFRPSQGWERKTDWPSNTLKVIGRTENDVVFGDGSLNLYRWNGTNLETLPRYPCFDSSSLVYFTLLGKNQIVGGLCGNGQTSASAWNGTAWETLNADVFNAFPIGPANEPMLLTHNALLTSDGISPLVPEIPRNATYLAASRLEAIAYLDGNRVVRLNAAREVASEYTTLFDGPGALGISKQLVASNDAIAWKSTMGYVVVCRM